MSPTWGGDFSSMELQKINIAFLTHIHSDHSAALADLILTPWIMGRDEPLRLYGPPGLKSMSENITEAYIDDINYRLYGSQPANELGFTTKVTEISKDGIIYKEITWKLQHLKILMVILKILLDFYLLLKIKNSFIWRYRHK